MCIFPWCLYLSIFPSILTSSLCISPPSLHSILVYIACTAIYPFLCISLSSSHFPPLAVSLFLKCLSSSVCLPLHTSPIYIALSLYFYMPPPLSLSLSLSLFSLSLSLYLPLSLFSPSHISLSLSPSLYFLYTVSPYPVSIPFTLSLSPPPPPTPTMYLHHCAGKQQQYSYLTWCREPRLSR